MNEEYGQKIYSRVGREKLHREVNMCRGRI